VEGSARPLHAEECTGLQGAAALLIPRDLTRKKNYRPSPDNVELDTTGVREKAEKAIRLLTLCLESY
jgi:hypothetical protein